MTDIPNSTASLAAPLNWALELWHNLKVRRTEQSARRKLGIAVSELNTGQLHDVGYVREARPFKRGELASSARPQIEMPITELRF